MLTQQTSRELSERIEALRGSDLSEEERGEIDLWTKGRALATLTAFYGWEVAMEMLQSYVIDATRKMLSTDPANHNEVLASHAVAFAANKIHINFVNDVHAAIEASKRAPEVVKTGHRMASEVPIESL